MLCTSSDDAMRILSWFIFQRQPRFQCNFSHLKYWGFAKMNTQHFSRRLTSGSFKRNCWLSVTCGLYNNTRVYSSIDSPNALFLHVFAHLCMYLIELKQLQKKSQTEGTFFMTNGPGLWCLPDVFGWNLVICFLQNKNTPVIILSKKELQESSNHDTIIVLEITEVLGDQEQK